MTSQQSADIRIMQGATFRVNFDWQAQSVDEQGNPLFDSTGTEPVMEPVSLAGYRAVMQMRDKADGAQLFFTATSDEDGGITLEPDGVVGRVAVRLGADITSTLTRTGMYDIILVAVDDPTEVERLAEGKAIVDKSVTLT